MRGRPHGTAMKTARSGSSGFRLAAQVSEQSTLAAFVAQGTALAKCYKVQEKVSWPQLTIRLTRGLCHETAPTQSRPQLKRQRT
mmetsp:Transcript_61079/g.113314  ORF Transcript_61079/g.113314 Transcript_61079/m.113314 type:complete len:84 (-) Transcript_61079:350-601(-)